MLTPKQEKDLDERDSDMKLCPHIVEVKELGSPMGPLMYILFVKGHMVLDDDTVSDDGTIHVEDHRLITMEIPMVPEVWRDFVDSINEVDATIKRVTEGYKPRNRSGIPPESIAHFMNSIPEIFLTNPDKDDDK